MTGAVATKTDQPFSIWERRCRIKELSDEYPGKEICRSCWKPVDKSELANIKSHRGKWCKKCHKDWSRSDRVGIKRLVDQAHVRAKRKGLECAIKKSDIVLPTHCPVLGIPLKWGSRKQRESSPSIDRINSNKGYTRDNIIIVSWLANNIKRNFDPSDIRKVGEFYEMVAPTTRRP